MSACYLYKQYLSTYYYYCELDNKVYSSIDQCVQNCGISIGDKLIFPNVGYEGYFFIVFALVLVLVLGLMYVLLDW